MRTTIEDAIQKKAEVEYYKDLEAQDVIEGYKDKVLVCEEAPTIFEYLPIRNSVNESEYIQHLWSSFLALDTDTAGSRSFSVFPFHLLFMLAVQYKILRISREYSADYKKAFSISTGRDHVKISSPKSVFDLALLNERSIPDLLKLIGADSECITRIKKDLIDNRNNNLAHAKGGIEPDSGKLVQKYLTSLVDIQGYIGNLNLKIVEVWISEIQPDDDVELFLETHLLDSCFTPRDFGDIIESLLEVEQLDFEQWSQVVNKGLGLAYEQTISALHKIAKNETDDGKRLNAIRVLQENGKIDEEMKYSIIKNEKDKVILELLNN